jgi:hypothetical protein
MTEVGCHSVLQTARSVGAAQAVRKANSQSSAARSSTLSVTWFLAPAHADALFRYIQPAFMAELAMLWRLIVGAKERPLVAAATG